MFFVIRTDQRLLMRRVPIGVAAQLGHADTRMTEKASRPSRRLPIRSVQTFQPLEYRKTGAVGFFETSIPDCGSGGRWFESTQLYQIRC